ncbi:cAMP-dependent protein kinase subunit [Sparganum proliferum]
MDLTKTLDKVNRKGLWKIMQKCGCPGRFTNMPTVQVIHTPDQDATDFTKCLEIVSRAVTSMNTSDPVQKIDYIVALYGSGGRTDHELGILKTLFIARDLTELPVLLVTESSISWLLLKTEPRLGDAIAVIRPLSEAVIIVCGDAHTDILTWFSPPVEAVTGVPMKHPSVIRFSLSLPCYSSTSELEIGLIMRTGDIASFQNQTVSPSSQSQAKSSIPHVQSLHSVRSNTVTTCWYHTTFGAKARRCISACASTSMQSKLVERVSPKVTAANLPGAHFMPVTPGVAGASWMTLAVNTSPITTSGTCSLYLDIGPRCLFPLVFVVADIPCAILNTTSSQTSIFWSTAVSPKGWFELSAYSLAAFEKVKAALADVTLLTHCAPDAPVGLFTSDIRHIDGSHNEVADALSKPSIAHVQLSPGTDLAEKAVEQLRVGSPCDEDVSELQFQDLPLTTDNGTILCDVSTTSRRSFVPPSLRRKVFSSLHNLSNPSDIDCVAAELVFGATVRVPGEMISPTPRAAVKDPTNLLHRLRQFMRSLYSVPPRMKNFRIQCGTPEEVMSVDCLKAAVPGTPQVLYVLLHLRDPLSLRPTYSLLLHVRCFQLQLRTRRPPTL